MFTWFYAFSFVPQLWSCISKARRRQFYLLFVLMLGTSLTEMLGVGIIFPYLAVLATPEQVFDNELAQPVIEFFRIAQPSGLIFPMTLMFCFVVLLSGAMRVLLIWMNTRLSFLTGVDISVELYSRTLHSPYEAHLNSNSSEIINTISSKVNNVIQNAILPVVTIASSMLICLTVTCVLFSINPKIALSAMVVIGLLYFFVVRFSHKQLLKNSETIAEQSTIVIKLLQEGLGGIREVIISGMQPVYADLYKKADIKFRLAQGNNVFTGTSPRYYMETAGMLVIAVLALMMTKSDTGIHAAIPTLGFLALSAQRLLPLLQQAYSAWSSIQGSKASIDDVLKLLAQPMNARNRRNHNLGALFEKDIKLNNVSFQYKNSSQPAIKNISLTIRKGDRLGIIGMTGSGKSTLMDIMMGLLVPSSGSIEVDGNVLDYSNMSVWQSQISHVPQSIYLIDDTIASNIAFGVKKDLIDRERLVKAAEKASLQQLISSLPFGYETVVGERGTKLSGGERQRIGIARAFYRNKNVIFFDEATSALDTLTESFVIKSFSGFGEKVTAIMVAHRLSSLKHCNKILELQNGVLLRVGKFEDFQ